LDARSVEVCHFRYFSACIVFITLAISFRIFHTGHISHHIIRILCDIPFSIGTFHHPVQGIINIPGHISLCIFDCCDVSPCIIGETDPAFVCLLDGLRPPCFRIGDLHFISKGIFRFYKPSLCIVFPAQFIFSIYPDPGWLVLFPIQDLCLVPKGIDHTHQISHRVIGILGLISKPVHIQGLLVVLVISKAFLPIAVDMLHIPVLVIMDIGNPAAVPFRKFYALLLFIIHIRHLCPVRELLQRGAVFLVKEVFHRHDPTLVLHMLQFPLRGIAVAEGVPIRKPHFLQKSSLVLVGQASSRMVLHMLQHAICPIGKGKEFPGVFFDFYQTERGSFFISKCYQAAQKGLCFQTHSFPVKAVDFLFPGTVCISFLCFF